LEISLGICLIIWTIEVIANSSELDINLFPGALISPLFTLFQLRITGSVLIVIGYAVFIFALIAFGNSWRIGIDKKSAGNLITNGIFSFTRNPIFLFIDIYFIGTWLIYSNIFFLVSAVVTVIGIHRHILEEERFLLKNYGTEYESYMKRVRRYF
jgi:protein-S-isoprenylcysteine O-methyltransferase Ste14